MTSVDILGNRGHLKCARSDSSSLIWNTLYVSVVDCV